MPSRDLSPSVWVAPGTARVSLGLILSAMNNSPQALDDFLSAYSPSSRVTINLPSAANTPFTITDTTNTRFVLVVMPFGNTNTCIISWNSGDTVSYINPNGFWFTTVQQGHIPSTLYFSTGGVINGVEVLTF